MSYYNRKKIVDPRLIKKQLYPTLKVLQVEEEYIPIILHELITNADLSIIRALNYTKVIYGRLFTIPLHRILDLLEPIVAGNLKSLIFFGSLDPSSFRLYCYWYSHFLHYVLVSPRRKNYKMIKHIDFDVVYDYLFSEARRGLQADTIRGQFSSIKHMLYPFRKIFVFLYDGNVEFKKLFQYIYKVHGRPKKKRQPVGYVIMFKILDMINFTVLIDVRDWCLIIILHVAGMRGGEIGPVKWTDVVVDTYTNTFTNEVVNIVVIFLDNTKTSNQSDSTVITISCPKEHSSFNILPVLKQYILLLKKEKRLNSWLFPSLALKDRNKDKHINTKTIRQITKKRVKQIGLNPDDFGAHSYRVAFVTDAIAAGIPEEFIKKLGRWKSQCWRGYFHDIQYAQAMATSQMMNFGKDFETKKSKKKHIELLEALTKKLRL